MRRNSYSGRNAGNQLVRPFLSSPVTLFVYLLLILSGVGLLEWVLRISTHAQTQNDLETRNVGLDEYYKNAALLPKRRVEDLHATTTLARRIKRQSGDIEGSDPTTSPNDESNPTTSPNNESNPTTSPNDESNPTPSPSDESNPTPSPSGESNPTTTPVTFDPGQSETPTSTTLPPITTTPPPVTTTPPPLTTTPPPITTTPPPVTTTPPPITTTRPTTTTPPPNDDETPPTTTANPLIENPPTSTTPTTTATPETTSTPVAPQESETPTATEEQPSTTPPQVTTSAASTPTPLAPVPVTTVTTSSVDSSSTASTVSLSTSPSLVPVILLSSSSSLSSSLHSPSPPSPSSPSPSSSLSSQTSVPVVSLASSSSLPTAVVVVVTSSTAAASTSQPLTTSNPAVPSTTNSLLVVSTASSVVPVQQTTVSADPITTSALPTTISSAQNSASTIAPAPVSSCRYGLNCLFANRHESVIVHDGYRTIPVRVTGLVEFTATIIPIFILILFQTFWLIIFASIKLNEPFHQLAQPEGTPPSTGLLFEFLDTGFPVDHFKAGFMGNWTSWYMITSYTILLILIIVPSLAAEAFSVQNLKAYCVNGSSKDSCVERVWTIAVGPVRALQVALIIVAILVFIVFVVRTYRGSALSLKKVTMALIADTLTDPRTVQTLQAINPDAPPEEAMPILHRHLWGLEPSIATEIGTENALYVLRSRSQRTATKENMQFESLNKISEKLAPYRPALDLLLPGFIIVILFLLVAIYAANGIDDSKLTLFFGSVTFGPKFVLVSITSMLGIALCRVEFEVRILTTYRSLYEAPDPRPLLSRRLHPSALTQAFASYKHKEWICAFTSFMAGYGTNILAMTISNIPYHPGRSVRGTIGCIFASLGLLIMMAVSLISVAFWRKGNSRLPIRKWPTSLADIYVLMVHSRVPGVEGVQGMEEHEELVTDFYGKEGDYAKMQVRQTVEAKEEENDSVDTYK